MKSPFELGKIIHVQQQKRRQIWNLVRRDVTFWIGEPRVPFEPNHLNHTGIIKFALIWCLNFKKKDKKCIKHLTFPGMGAGSLDCLVVIKSEHHHHKFHLHICTYVNTKPNWVKHLRSDSVHILPYVCFTSRRREAEKFHQLIKSFVICYFPQSPSLSLVPGYEGGYIV